MPNGRCLVGYPDMARSVYDDRIRNETLVLALGGAKNENCHDCDEWHSLLRPGIDAQVSDVARLPRAEPNPGYHASISASKQGRIGVGHARTRSPLVSIAPQAV